jgi:hypothetical protein
MTFNPELLTNLAYFFTNTDRQTLEESGIIQPGRSGDDKWERFNHNFDIFILKSDNKQLQALANLANAYVGKTTPSPQPLVMGGEPTPSRPEASSTTTGALPLCYGSPSADLAEPVPPAKLLAGSIAVSQAEAQALLYGVPKHEFTIALSRLANWLAEQEDGVAAPVSQGSDHSLASGRGIPRVRPPEDESTVAPSGEANFQEFDIISDWTPSPTKRMEIAVEVSQ